MYERFLKLIDAERAEIISLGNTDLGQVVTEIKSQPQGVEHILLVIHDTLSLLAEEVVQFAKTRQLLTTQALGDRDFRMMLNNKYKVLRQLFAHVDILKDLDVFLTEMTPGV